MEGRSALVEVEQEGVEVLIHVSHLTKIYQMGDTQTTALSDVSFDVQKGEFVAIMGPSGSGKSTLMHMLGALDTPTSGTYILDGSDVSKLSDDQLAEIRNKKIGFVFQAFNLLPRTSSLKNVMLPLIYAGIPKGEQEERAKKYLEMVGLGNRLNHSTSQLSVGTNAAGCNCACSGNESGNPPCR